MLARRNFLLADDDREVRNGVADLLDDLGLEIYQAESGLEALEIVRRERIDGALLDLHMPGCHDLGPLPMIHAERSNLPCLVYSGNLTPVLEQALLRAGALAVLRKPVQPELLRREVRRVLRLDLIEPGGGPLGRS